MFIDDKFVTLLAACPPCPDGFEPDVGPMPTDGVIEFRKFANAMYNVRVVLTPEEVQKAHNYETEFKAWQLRYDIEKPIQWAVHWITQVAERVQKYDS